MNVYALREKLDEFRRAVITTDAPPQVSALFAFNAELVDAIAELNREVMQLRASLADTRQSLANVTGRRAA